jgi:hypothetical protein
VTTSLYGADWARAAAQQRDAVAMSRQSLERAIVDHDHRRATVAEQANHALAELVGVLLPDLSATTLATAAQQTGYTPLVTADVATSMQREAADLDRRLQSIEANELFSHREHLRDPRGGKLIVELAELDSARASLEPLVTLASHPRLPHLLEVGYGTSSYDVPFWRLSYYTDWEAGDAVLEALPQFKTFGDFRAEYERATGALASLAERRAQIERDLRQGAALDLSHASALQAKQTIVPRALERLRSALGRHIVDSGQEVLAPLFSSFPALDVLGKRVFGLAAKLRYFDALRTSELSAMQRDLDLLHDRAERDLLKFSRPKNAQYPISQEKFDQRFKPFQPRFTKRWERYQHTADTIYVFDRYDRGSWVSDFLWWDVMTDGRLDGDFVPEVMAHHQRYPDYHYESDRLADRSHVAAFESDLGSDDSTFGLDPS